LQNYVLSLYQGSAKKTGKEVFYRSQTVKKGKKKNKKDRENPECA